MLGLVVIVLGGGVPFRWVGKRREGRLGGGIEVGGCLSLF